GVGGLGNRKAPRWAAGGADPAGGAKFGDANFLEAALALEEHVEIPEHIQPREHHLGPVRNNLLPVFAAGACRRRAHQTEVPPAVVGADVKILAVVVQVIFVVVFARRDSSPLAFRLASAEVSPPGGGVAVGALHRERPPAPPR